MQGIFVMDNSPKKLIKLARTLSAISFRYLKNVLLAGLSYPFKKKPKEAFDFMITLKNIPSLGDGRMAQDANCKPLKKICWRVLFLKKNRRFSLILADLNLLNCMLT